MLTGYWSFPLVKRADLRDQDRPTETTEEADLAVLQEKWAQENQLTLDLKPLGGRQVSHTYTHQRWQVKLLVAELTTTPTLNFLPGRWVAAEHVTALPLPKVQEKMMARYEQQIGQPVFQEN